MIKDKKIKVSISYRNINHYVKLGYRPSLGTELEIKTEGLPSSSHTKVDVICNICSKETTLMYCKYIENKKRLGFYGCKSCSSQKAVITSLEKYGVDNYSKTDGGTLSSGGVPVISTSGSHKFDTIFSKCEMIFRKKLIV